MTFSDSEAQYFVRKSHDLEYRPTSWYASYVSPRPNEQSRSGGARSKLLDAAVLIIREKGYAATSVDELCASAGVTKGAFFHHFPSKDSLAVADRFYCLLEGKGSLAGRPAEIGRELVMKHYFGL